LPVKPKVKIRVIYRKIDKKEPIFIEKRQIVGLENYGKSKKIGINWENWKANYYIRLIITVIYEKRR
jgi:hypothetical protein